MRRPLRSRVGCLLGVLLSVAGCSAPTYYAQTASSPQRDAAAPMLDAGQPKLDAGPAPCPASLAERITITRIDLDVAIRYKRPGYDNYPLDERVPISLLENGSGYIAWVDNAGASVRVTPIDANLMRRAPDIVVPGTDIGGLAAREDGFALLTRRDDPGEPLTEPGGNSAVKAAVLVRYKNGVQLFAAPLTGTASITRASNPAVRDCVPYLYSRLAWNGAKYGAYLMIRGCNGDAHEAAFGDKFVYVDDRGQYLRGGWGWNCSSNQGLRFLPEPDVFTTLCLSDALPFPGLNLVVEGVPARQLAPEMVQVNYTAGQFGSIIKLNDGSYAIGWLSRGVVDANATPLVAAKPAMDMALLRLAARDRDYSSLGPHKWLLETPNIGEANMHLAPYGPDRLLLLWDATEGLRCDDRSCFGNYAGTHARLIDTLGNFLTTDELIPAVPNTNEDLLTLPNGDLVFAYVPDTERSYAAPLTSARLTSKRRIDIARVRYCE